MTGVVSRLFTASTSPLSAAPCSSVLPIYRQSYKQEKNHSVKTIYNYLVMDSGAMYYDHCVCFYTEIIVPEYLLHFVVAALYPQYRLLLW